MTSPSDLDLNSVKISTQTLGETIYQFVDLPGLPSIQERIIHTQEDQVKKALADLGWICPQEAKAMRADLSAKDAEIAKLKDEVHSERAHWQDRIVRERKETQDLYANGVMTAIAPLAKLPHIGDPPSAGVVLVGRVWHEESEVRKAAESLGLREPTAVVAPEISFAKIELGFGRVEVGEGTWMDVPALIFGKNGNGVVGKPTEAGSRFLGVDECLAIVTFANVESLDVVLGKLMKCRSDRFPDAIPADRVLGDGMVAVDRNEYETKRRDSRQLHDCIAEFERLKAVTLERKGIPFMQLARDALYLDGVLAVLTTNHDDSLRANQGGADHGNG